MNVLPRKPLDFLSLPIGQPITTVLQPTVAGGLIEIDGNMVPAASRRSTPSTSRTRPTTSRPVRGRR